MVRETDVPQILDMHVILFEMCRPMQICIFFQVAPAPKINDLTESGHVLATMRAQATGLLGVPHAMKFKVPFSLDQPAAQRGRREPSVVFSCRGVDDITVSRMR